MFWKQVFSAQTSRFKPGNHYIEGNFTILSDLGYTSVKILFHGGSKMNLKWKKNTWGRFWGLSEQLFWSVESISTLVPTSNQTIKREFNQTSKKVTQAKGKAIDLSGDYVSNERDEAKIEKKG